MEALGADRRDALRNRLSVEEVLLAWQKAGGTDDFAVVELGRRLRRLTLAVRCGGLPRDPFAGGEAGGLERQLLTNLGLGLTYRYRDGVNTVSCTKKIKRRLGQLALVLLALAAALALGGLLMLLPGAWRGGLLTGVLDPLFNTFLGVFSCIVGPMMFI